MTWQIVVIFKNLNQAEVLGVLILPSNFPFYALISHVWLVKKESTLAVTLVDTILYVGLKS